MKKLLALLLALLMVMAIVGCAKEEAPADDGAADAPADAAGGAIVYSAYDMQYEYYVTLSSGVEEACIENGYEFIEHDQKGDESIMISGSMDYLAQDDVVGIVMTPCKPEAVGPVIEAAAEAGKPLVMVDYCNVGIGYEAFITSDNYYGGYLAGEYAAELLGDTSIPVAAIGSDQQGASNRDRMQGFVDAVEEAGYTVVAALDGQSDSTVAYNCARDIVAANPDVGLIWCGNDPMAISASQAAEEAGLVPGEDVHFIGFDAAEVAYEAIKLGTLSGTIQQQPALMGAMGVETVIKLLNGETLEFDNEEDKIIYSEVKLINIDNVEDIAP